MRQGRARGRKVWLCTEHSFLFEAKDLGVKTRKPLRTRAGPAYRGGNCPGCGRSFEKHEAIVVDSSTARQEVWHEACWDSRTMTVGGGSSGAEGD